ncbi:prolipoprotein diacylglyceryl transferase [Candidatus Gracilibacteria bacterium]|nr:prolipoprotein diacylglyceryl transferase [Candidatus Gracilibacteria bacterium]
MYPTLEIFSIQIYTFGFILACSWLLFISLLHKFSQKKGIIRPIFGDIATFTISILFFARVFHILADWVNEKFIFEYLFHGDFIEFFRLFFIPPNYLFSLFGGIFGFMFVFSIKTRQQKENRAKYLEAIVYAFLGASILGFLGSFLGGQIYGIPFDSIISVTYSHADSIVKDSVPLFPLALFYMVFTGIILLGLHLTGKRHHFPVGFMGYIGLGCFSLLIFFGEFLSGSRNDIFYDLVIRFTHGYFGMSLNQIGSLIGISFSIIGILRITEREI